MLYVFLKELKHAYRMYSVKRKFILQYSRKGMIEQNYFKSSRDNGPLSKKKGKKLSKVGSSSRDDGSPRKDRRRRRRRDDGIYGTGTSKSSLVAKNDVDDVAEAGSDFSYDNSQSQKHTREYMRKLRDAETVHKLQQIAEVDENEDSDDAFGPVAENGDDGYQMVSNRSTYRKGTASRDGPRDAPTAAPVKQVDDDGFSQPIPEIDVEDAGSSAAASKKKKKKKGKKKKPKTNLAEIGEDMLDSPVNSAGNDDDAGASRALNDEPTESHASANNNTAKDADVVDEPEDNNNSGVDRDDNND